MVLAREAPQPHDASPARAGDMVPVQEKAPAQENCTSLAEEVMPSCAQECYLSIASDAGCGEFDFPCQCEEDKKAELTTLMMPCVLTACDMGELPSVIAGGSSGSFSPPYCLKYAANIGPSLLLCICDWRPGYLGAPSRRRTDSRAGTGRARAAAGEDGRAVDHVRGGHRGGGGLRRPPADIRALREGLPLARRPAGGLRDGRLRVPVRTRQAGGAEHARGPLRAGLLRGPGGCADPVGCVTQ